MPPTLWISQPLKPVAIEASAFVIRLGEKNIFMFDQRPLPAAQTSLNATLRTTIILTICATIPAPLKMISSCSSKGMSSQSTNRLRWPSSPPPCSDSCGP